MGGYIALIVPVMALSIPIVAIILTHRSGIHKNKLKELELKKEILELEIVKQNSQIKLLETESKKLDREINA